MIPDQIENVIGHAEFVPRHIVAVVALVQNEQHQILMVESPRRGWELPGGQIEEGEAVTEALSREVSEETGVTVVLEQLVGIYSNLSAPSKVIFAFTARALGGLLRPSAESVRVEWVERGCVLARITHAAIRQRAADLLDHDEHGSRAICYRTYTVDPYIAHTESLL